MNAATKKGYLHVFIFFLQKATKDARKLDVWLLSKRIAEAVYKALGSAPWMQGYVLNTKQC